MVFGNLVENRICYKGDGGGDTGSSGNDSPAPVTNPTVERGRGAEPAPAPARPSRPSNNRDPNNDRPSDNQPTPIAAAPTLPGGQNLSARPTQAQNLTTMVADAVADAQTARRFPPPTTDRQMLAASADPNLNPFPAPSAAVTPALTPATSPGSNNAEQAAIVEALVSGAAEQSLEQGGGTDILDSVESVPGRNDPRSGFFADAFDELNRPRLDDGFPDPNAAPVTAPGTALGIILGAGPVSGLFGGNTPDPADAAAFNVGQLMSLPGAVRDPQTGAITGATAGPGTLNMNRFGMVTYSGVNDPTYTGAFQNLVRGTAGLNGTENDRPSDNQTAMQPADSPMDPGTTTPEQIDDLAVNYLQNPFYLYSGQGNLFQPYGYAGNTLVDLLQTRNMQMPGQAAPNLGLFGNPRDFS